MKKNVFIILLGLSLFFTQASAKEINLINGNPPGSSTDYFIKMIGDEYKKLTGDKFVQSYHPGGSGRVAVAKFLNADKETILIGSTALHIWNPILEKTLPYKDSDFKPVTFLGNGPIFYVSNIESGIKNIDDLLIKLPKSKKPFVAGYANSINVSVELLQKKGHLQNVEVVVTKGAPDVLVNILNGATPVGLIGSGVPSLFTLHKEGKLNVIASTWHEDLVLEGVKVPSISKKLNVPQSLSGFSLVMHHDVDKNHYDVFYSNIRKIFSDEKFRKKLIEKNIWPADVFGPSDFDDYVKKMRTNYREVLK